MDHQKELLRLTAEARDVADFANAAANYLAAAKTNPNISADKLAAATMELRRIEESLAEALQAYVNAAVAAGWLVPTPAAPPAGDPRHAHRH